MSLPHRILRRAKRIMDNNAARRRGDVPGAEPRPPRTAPTLEGLADCAVLVVMAHPDDEAIAAGALMARVPRLGVVCITDGAPRTGSWVREAGFDNWMDYAGARRLEAEAALALLQREIAPFRNLGIGDQEAALHLAPAARFLARAMQTGFTHVITHAYEGGHPDHDSTAFCVHAAAALIAKSGATPPAIVEAPLYNAPNGRFQHSKFLPHDDAGPETVFALSPVQQDSKRQMFACHVTQAEVFAPFDVTAERFRLAPRYHFLAPPDRGDVGYNQYMGAFTGMVWRRHAGQALRELGLMEELA
ncbi:MAG TPA: PIG-L family deacetylase [Rhizomicrobium sp.]